MGLYESLPRVKSCCCCINLRTGVLILGILQIIAAVASWAYFIFCIVKIASGEEPTTAKGNLSISF